MKKQLLIFLSLIILGCDELVRTQNKAPEIILDKTEVPADGISEIMITATADRELSENQTIRFTTTEGNLVALPLSPSSVLTKEIAIIPRDQKVSVILRSSLEEKNNVIISATVNNLIAMETVKFNRSCPDEVQISLDKTFVTTTDSILVSFTFLRNDAHNISLNTRIDCTIDPNTIASITPTVFSDSFGKASAIIKPISTGTGSIIFSSKSGCSAKILPKGFEVK